MSLLEIYINTHPEFSTDECEKTISLINKFRGYGFISEDERATYFEEVEGKKKKT